MNQRELLEAANAARPDLMQKTAQAVALLERMDPDFTAEVTKDFQVITTFASEKTAGPDMRGFGYAVGGTILAGLGSAIATDLYDAARRGLTKGVNFKRIMEANPDLKSYDQKRLKDSFSTLHRYGSEFTSDPLMGGSLLKAVAGLEGNEHTLIKDVIKARKEYLEGKAKRFSPGHVGIEMQKDGPDHAALENLKHKNRMKEITWQQQMRENSEKNRHLKP